MLQDPRATYIRREEPGFLGRSVPVLKTASIWVVGVASLLALILASLKSGEMPKADPMTYFPYIMPVVE